MRRLHASGTTYVKRNREGQIVSKIDGCKPGWRGHAKNELARRRKANKVAKQSRKAGRR